ncbi:hypothetical protein BDR26DRAFT_936265 [Obelidium mucronatum]|nr:hypothetical protein BDR26DRAFT_936265 [Obelidium mucronatum]
MEGLFIKDALDARAVVEAAIAGRFAVSGLLRPHEIRSGSVRVLEDGKGSFKKNRRLRDGFDWSPSRTSGPFQLFRRVDYIGLDPHRPLREPTQSEESPLFQVSCRRNMMLIPNGLARRTIRVTGSNNLLYLVVSYFTPRHVEHFYNRLPNYKHWEHILTRPLELSKFSNLGGRTIALCSPTPSDDSEPETMSPPMYDNDWRVSCGDQQQRGKQTVPMWRMTDDWPAAVAAHVAALFGAHGLAPHAAGACAVFCEERLNARLFATLAPGDVKELFATLAPGDVKELFAAPFAARRLLKVAAAQLREKYAVPLKRKSELKLFIDQISVSRQKRVASSQQIDIWQGYGG